MNESRTNQDGTPLPKIGAPATRALAGAGYFTIESLDGASASDLLRLHGMGPKAMSILKVALAERALSFTD
ncbi:hypothetical protein FHU41_001046 [Psychromicrobium silvestre]|uniref:DNA-binding protein n=1 Tax=Psychromicrobium silvestre TaxID=1645614 RepID=A0A7Y9LSK1_9MICC|nr:DNA-binding protein [Psychromicrobium silvestre]NYE94825.1 hypothetical protein [Psychromicrobium silvestre]